METKEKQDASFIDVTPTWEGIFPTMLYLYANASTAQAKQTAVDEFRRMAKFADKYVESQKQVAI